jgi:hypothetical protein
MPIPKFASPLAILWSLVLCSGLLSQEQPVPKSVSQQIEAIADNDFWLSTDRYYTTGSFLNYRQQLGRNDSLRTSGTLTLGLEQLLYTPDNIRDSNVATYDRPYAGFLGVSASWTGIFEQDIFSVKGLLGVAGPNSGAEEFQNLFHEKGGIDTPPWTAQIENSFHYNLYAMGGREWYFQDSSSGWSLAFMQHLALGTKDIYFQPQMNLFFGKRNYTHKSVAYRQLGPLTDELFALLRVGYRFVFHDAMLEGNFAGDDSVLLVGSNTHLFKLSLEGHWRWGKNDITAGYHFTTAEAPTTENHAYVSLSYARGFN